MPAPATARHYLRKLAKSVKRTSAPHLYTLLGGSHDSLETRHAVRIR